MVVFLFIFLSNLWWSTQTYSVHILKGSSFIIHGSSNVNEFDCAYTYYKNFMDNVKVKQLSKNQYVIQHMELSINTCDLDCGNRIMNNDLQKLLKSDKYSSLILNPKKLLLLSERGGRIEVDLTITDQMRTESIYVDIQNLDSYTKVCGIIELDICEFGLVPPQKMMGLITVNSTIAIDFALLLDIKES